MKVLIVEDELPIREWMVFVARGLEKYKDNVLSAENGEKAWEIFEKERPELIISDICMPVMDGLKLAGKIYHEAPETQVAILTCHTDFEYAREAMKYGVMEYVLKTEVNGHIMEELLDRMSERRKQKELEQKGPDTLRINREVYLQRLIDSETAPITAKELRSKGISLEEKDFFVIMLKLSLQNQKEDRPVTLPGSEKISNMFGFLYDQQTLALVGNIKEEASGLKKREELLRYCSRLKTEMKCPVGCADIHYRFEKFGQALREAYESIQKSFYMKEDTVILYEKKTYDGFSEMLKECREEIPGSEAKGSLEKALKMIGDLLKKAEEEHYPDISDLKRQLGWLFTKRNLEFSLEELENVRNIKGLYKIYNSILEDARQKSGKGYSYPVRRALEYMDKNFAVSLSLADIAGDAGFSPEYFCRLFKNEVGMNFSVYLQELRLRESARLLRETGYKVYEIAEMVGYNNLSYYSRIFKKKYGVNPYEYRNS